MLVALQYRANPETFKIEQLNLVHQPEFLRIARLKKCPVLSPNENPLRIADSTAAIIEKFRCTYTNLPYQGKLVPIYEEMA